MNARIEDHFIPIMTTFHIPVVKGECILKIGQSFLAK